MKFLKIISVTIVILNLINSSSLAKSTSKTKKFEVLQHKGINIIPAYKRPPKGGKTVFGAEGKFRVMKATGLPKHEVGDYPNDGCPYKMKIQDYNFKAPLSPKLAKKITPLTLDMNFGVSMTGIPFDPLEDIWFKNNPKSGWQYEAMSGAIFLGIDDNRAHLNKNGTYHFHGPPTSLLKIYGLAPGRESPLIGYAADGFPIYALYGDDGKSVNPSYVLKEGKRSIGGIYDGTFIQDYEYKKGAGDLDECNGKMFHGSYAYFLTYEFPFIPRCFKGEPHLSFKKK